MYLTRNQAGVYSASGVRIPPSPPDKRKGLPFGSPFLLSGAGRDARFARRPTRCAATRGPLPLPASPRPCRGSPSTEGLASPDGSGRGCGIDDFLVSAGIEDGCRKAALFFYLARDATRVSRAAPHVASQRVGPSLCLPLPAPVGAAPQQRGLFHPAIPCVADASHCLDEFGDHPLDWRGLPKGSLSSFIRRGNATRVSRVARDVAPLVARWVHPRTAWKARPFAQGGDRCPVRMACAQNV